MKQYRIYFLSSDSLVVSEEEFQSLMNAFAEKLNNEGLRGFVREDKTILLTKENITHILSESIESESTVVTPPTPAELRDEEQRTQADIPVTLDEQLANEEVGK